MEGTNGCLPVVLAVMSRDTNWKVLRGEKKKAKEKVGKKKREGRINSVGNVMCGMDSKKWGKLNMDNEEQRKFDFMPQRKPIDFVRVTLTSLQTSVFKENNEERFTDKRAVEESTSNLERERKALV